MSLVYREREVEPGRPAAVTVCVGHHEVFTVTSPHGVAVARDEAERRLAAALRSLIDRGAGIRA